MAPREAPILVVDDDPKIVALVRMYLERERYPVVTAADGRAALLAIEADRPRLVVLDLMLPGLDGLEVMREARTLGDTPILVLSARGSTGDRIVGLSEGADDYLPKPFSPAELVVRVRAILRRSGRVPEPAGATLQMADLALDVARDQVSLAGADVELSVLERRLLRALMEADGRTLTREQLLDAIHGAGQSDAFDRAIDVYVKRLREKLGDDAGAPRYVATVRGVGYRAASPVTR
ncbi:MAG TPA: response regulator transcription factor [Candidatus Limnocylindrales bacterium]